jgi:hypothetical protein
MLERQRAVSEDVRVIAAGPKGLGHDFGPSRRPEQQDIAGKRL